MGALSSTSSAEVNPHDGNLTFLGRVLSSLPVDIRLGKLMLLGHVFGVLKDTIIISAYSCNQNAHKLFNIHKMSSAMYMKNLMLCLFWSI